MNQFIIKERAAKAANRACYAVTAVVVATVVAVVLTGKPHVEYRVTFGNAEAAETVQVAATKEQMDAMHRASEDDVKRIEAAKARVMRAQAAALIGRPAEKPPVPQQ